MTEDIERAVYVQRIAENQVDEYVEAHERVPEGVKEAMARGGVEEFELYLRDGIAVCILEAEDLDAYLESVSGDPDVEEWERHVAQFKESGVDVDAPADEQIPFMDRIWSFSPQKGERSS